MYRPGCHIRRLLPFRLIGPLSCTAHANSEKAAWIPLPIHIGSGAGDDLSPGYVSDPGTRPFKS